MDLSMTTDYVTYLGNPEPYLNRIANAGFTHIHWCHQWNTDFLYSKTEIEQIAKKLRTLGIRLLDLHASNGIKGSWGSLSENERLAGVSLIRNRIEMTARLSGGVIVLHIPRKPENPAHFESYWSSLQRSLDELYVCARAASVKIALENIPRDDFADHQRLFSIYEAEFLGLCYDSGHGNIGCCGLDHLQKFKDRLISVHLHDNDGSGDQHGLPFSGTVDWKRLARILAVSTYDKCVSLESNMRGQTIQEGTYLKQAHEAAATLSRMIRRDTVNRLCTLM